MKIQYIFGLICFIGVCLAQDETESKIHGNLSIEKKYNKIYLQIVRWKMRSRKGWRKMNLTDLII